MINTFYMTGGPGKWVECESVTLQTAKQEADRAYSGQDIKLAVSDPKTDRRLILATKAANGPWEYAG